ncbi:MAG TPA: hypothetical protein VF723_06985 [Pyrinomonadaceae bacterium]
MTRHTGVPIYRQLDEGLRVAVPTGQLRAGGCLPSTCKLAQALRSTLP